MFSPEGPPGDLDPSAVLRGLGNPTSLTFLFQSSSLAVATAGADSVSSTTAFGSVGGASPPVLGRVPSCPEKCHVQHFRVAFSEGRKAGVVGK